MAKIQRIDHDHQAPFLVVVLVGFKAETQGKNKLPYDYYTSDPPDFYRF
jgi:hypothetical protein